MGSIVGAVTKIGTSLLSGGAKKKASKKAQKALQAAYDKAYPLIQATQDEQEEHYAPYAEAGRMALGELAQGIEDGEYTTPFNADMLDDDDGYQFRRTEGLRALDRTANARGSLFSGAQLRGTQDYAQDLASQEYQSAYDRYNGDLNSRWQRLMGLGTVGYNADNGIAASLGAENDNLTDNILGRSGAKATGIRERGAITAGTIESIGGTIAGAANDSKGLAQLASLFG